MYATLYKYLALNKNLNIPGLGNFSITETPATLQFTDKKLHAPQTSIGFTQVVHPTNNHFYTFLSREWSVDKVIAIRMYKEGVEDILDALKKSGTFDLPGIGTIRKQGEDNLEFQEAESVQFFTTLPAERVLRKNAQHRVLVGEQEHKKTHTIPQQPTEELVYEEPLAKDRWWVYAIVLAVLAILMIVYYYAAR